MYIYVYIYVDVHDVHIANTLADDVGTSFCETPIYGFLRTGLLVGCIQFPASGCQL